MSLTSMQVLVRSSCLFVTSGPVRVAHFCSLVLFLTCPTWFDLFNKACVASSTLLLTENTPLFFSLSWHLLPRRSTKDRSLARDANLPKIQNSLCSYISLIGNVSAYTNWSTLVFIHIQKVGIYMTGATLPMSKAYKFIYLPTFMSLAVVTSFK